MLIDRYKNLEDFFSINQANYWSNLSRFNNLLVIINISMFFLTGQIGGIVGQGPVKMREIF